MCKWSINKFPTSTIVAMDQLTKLTYLKLKKEFGFHYDTQCDGEAIIHLYTHGGIEFCAKQLDGEFAFCLVDTLKRRVFLGRDTYGIKPMFKIYNDSGFLALCSEIKGKTRTY
jgi:asparagine synthase (glutamine-hydrolysing)